MDTLNFSDIFKNSFLDNFNNAISKSSVITTMMLALLFSLIVFYVYKLTCDNVIYSKKFNVTMSLMTLITAAVVMSMQANVVVSLGMVGALSIVRFRTAIKEPKDLLFLFWSISNGIIIGAGAYFIVFILAPVLTIGLLVFEKLPGNKIPYLLVISLENLKDEEEIIKILDKNKIKYRVKSKNISTNSVDIIYELSNDKINDLIQEISTNKGMISLNLITQDGECQF